MGKGSGDSCRAAMTLDGSELAVNDVDPQRLRDEIEQACTLPMLDQHQIATLRLVGSHAYGLAHAESDLDLRGVYVAPTEQLFELRPPSEQLQSKDPDVVVYELAKFVKLAANANPNVLEILWAPAVRGDETGQLLEDHRQLFLSQKVRTTYSGYAMSQCKKLSSVEAKRPDKREKFARHLFRLFEQGRQLLETGDMSLRVADPERLLEMSRWPTERIEAEFRRLDAAFRQIDSPLPAEPDFDQVNALLRQIRLDALRAAV